MPASSFLHGFVVLLLLASQANSQAPAVGLFDQILPAISNPSLANLRVAEQAWQSQDPATADVLSKYTMAMARVANNRDVSALELIESIPTAVRSVGPIWRLRIWLAFKADKDELVHAEVRAFIDELKVRSAKPPSPKDLDDLQFLSQLVCYLESVAHRDGVLAPDQAKTWREALAALPAGWNEKLVAIQTELTAAYRQREQALKDGYAPWREKTDLEYAAAQQKTAAIVADAKTASDAVAAAVTAQETFTAAAKPQLQTLEASFNQLTAQRNAIRVPREPKEPSRPQRTGNRDRDSKNEDAYDRALRQYNSDLGLYKNEKAEYDRKVEPIDEKIRSVNGTVKGLVIQDAQLQQNIQLKKAELAKFAKPQQLAERNELRLKNLLADRPAWDSPGTLATLRSLDAYVQINLAREVARIQAARLK